MFKIENQYKGSNNNKIISKVIDPAKKELDEKSPYSFDFDPIKKVEEEKLYLLSLLLYSNQKIKT